MTENLVRETRFTTFDGTVSIRTKHQRPDRFSHLEGIDKASYRIPRGGGYSYSASSFGEHSLVQDMTRFNRFLAFAPGSLTLRVEAGVRLLDLMEWALSQDLYFPVLPGYPLITIGGCVASDVHGKNPYKDGTFCDWVLGLTVFHPHKGYQFCSPSQSAELFALTCGGYGLSGVITDVTLQLMPLPAAAMAMTQNRVSSLQAGQSMLASCDADIAYSWHAATPGSHFGRGIVYTGHWSDRHAPAPSMALRPMTADSRARLPFSAWNSLTARLLNSSLLLHSRFSRDVTVVDVLNACFPFASNVYFHTLFGRPGLRETQFLVREEKISQCIDALHSLTRDMTPPMMILSMKKFKGTQKSLSMSGTGYLIAIDCYRNEKTEPFMRQLDQLVLDMQGQPNLSKDSRLPTEVAQLSVAGYEAFKQQLFHYDDSRIFRSELSARLGLL